MLAKKQLSLKDKHEQELEQLKEANEELIIQKLKKKKIDLHLECDKKDAHNILNSFLHGDIYEEDLFNQFWEYYFRKSAKLTDIVTAYVNTINMLIQKIINNQIKINQLIKGRQKYKQNHDYKNINMATLLIENHIVENNQYNNDLDEMSKPFAFNFKDLLAEKLTAIKNSDEQAEIIKSQENKEVDFLDIMVDDIIDHSNFLVDQQKSEQEDDLNLSNQEKYYRFITYIIIIIFIVQVTTSYNKYNTPNLIVMLILLLNSLFEQLLVHEDPVNQLLQRIEVNTHENRLEELSQNLYKIDRRMQDKLKKYARPHKFDNYTSFLMITIIFSLIQDILWLITMSYTYKHEVNLNNTLNLSVWKYNRYIIYCTMFNAFAKVVIFIFSFQLCQLKITAIFSKFSLYLLFIRFLKISQFKELFKIQKEK